MKKTLQTSIILIMFLSTVPSYSQSLFKSRTAWQVAYFGELITHPGLSLGIEHYLNEEEKYQIFFRPTLSGYHHERSNTSLLLTIESGHRRNFTSGFFLEQSLGIGYIHRFIQGDGYFYTDQQGAILEKSTLGIPFVAFLANMGLGFHFHAEKSQVSPFVRPNFYWKMPFNDTPNMQLALQIGVLLRPKNR